MFGDYLQRRATVLDIIWIVLTIEFAVNLAAPHLLTLPWFLQATLGLAAAGTALVRLFVFHGVRTTQTVMLGTPLVFDRATGELRSDPAHISQQFAAMVFAAYTAAHPEDAKEIKRKGAGYGDIIELSHELLELHFLYTVTYLFRGGIERVAEFQSGGLRIWHSGKRSGNLASLPEIVATWPTNRFLNFVASKPKDQTVPAIEFDLPAGFKLQRNDQETARPVEFVGRGVRVLIGRGAYLGVAPISAEKRGRLKLEAQTAIDRPYVTTFPMMTIQVDVSRFAFLRPGTGRVLAWAERLIRETRAEFDLAPVALGFESSAIE